MSAYEVHLLGSPQVLVTTFVADAADQLCGALSHPGSIHQGELVVLCKQRAFQGKASVVDTGSFQALPSQVVTSCSGVGWGEGQHAREGLGINQAELVAGYDFRWLRLVVMKVGC